VCSLQRYQVNVHDISATPPWANEIIEDLKSINISVSDFIKQTIEKTMA